MRTSRILAIALFLCAAAASASVINFEEFPNTASGNNPTVGTAYSSLGVTFIPSTQGIAAGMANGDPGGWSVNGTNGPKVLAFGAIRGRSMRLSFAHPQNYVSFDVAAAGLTAPGMTLNVMVWHDAMLLTSFARTLGAVNSWHKVEILAYNITDVSWSAPQDYAVDNIVLKSNLVNGTFETNYDVNPWIVEAANSSIAYVSSDIDGRFGSGAGVVLNGLNTTSGGAAAHQCVSIGQLTPYTLAANIFVQSGQAATGHGQLGASYYGTDDCSTSYIGSAPGTAWVTTPAWTRITISQVTPIGTHSLLVSLGSFKTGGTIDGTVFGVMYDNVVFTPRRSDFDANRSEDLVLRNYSTGQNAVWLMNGTSLASIHDLPALPTSYSIVGSADFNGDGDADILLRRPATGQDAVWLMQGTDLLSIVDLPALPGTNWHIEGTGDFNADGWPDIIWRNYVTGQNALWIMNATSLSHIVDLPALANGNYAFESSGDFNGDGWPDIVLRNYATGQDAIWLMRGTSLVSIVDLPALPNTAYHIDAVGDFNGDARPDIVWRNYTTGQNAFWEMNGTSINTIHDLPALPNTWYEINGPR